MAKQEKRTRRRVVVQGERRIDFVKLCAFWGIFLSAVLLVASGILNLVNVNSTIISVLDIIAKLALLVGIGFPAYSYVRGKRRVWRIIYWVVLIVYILGCVFAII